MRPSVGRVLFGFVVTVALAYCVFLLITTSQMPSNYALDDASAVQVTQVYTMMLFDVGFVIGLLLAGILFMQVLAFLDVID